jgi:hypothetical protein
VDQVRLSPTSDATRQLAKALESRPSETSLAKDEDRHIRGTCTKGQERRRTIPSVSEQPNFRRGDQGDGGNGSVSMFQEILVIGGARKTHKDTDNFLVTVGDEVQ